MTKHVRWQLMMYQIANAGKQNSNAHLPCITASFALDRPKRYVDSIHARMMRCMACQQDS